MNVHWRQALLLVLSMACAPAFAHSRLLSSNPASAAVLAQAPATLALGFNEAVEIAFTTVELKGPGKTVKLEAAADAGGDRSKVVAPLPALEAGVYRVTWATVGHDGHHVKGEFSFTVR